MDTFHGDLDARCAEFCRRYGATRIRTEGAGIQGVVFFTDRVSAVKVFIRENHYKRERDVYLRLHHHDVSNVCGFDVPELQLFDNDNWAIEMSVVSPPFLLDFAGAYLDEPPDYSDEVVIESRAKHAELFGGDWPAVQMAVSALKQFGIYMVDLHPGNIRSR